MSVNEHLYLIGLLNWVRTHKQFKSFSGKWKEHWRLFLAVCQFKKRVMRVFLDFLPLSLCLLLLQSSIKCGFWRFPLFAVGLSSVLFWHYHKEILFLSLLFCCDEVSWTDMLFCLCLFILSHDSNVFFKKKKRTRAWNGRRLLQFGAIHPLSIVLLTGRLSKKVTCQDLLLRSVCCLFLSLFFCLRPFLVLMSTVEYEDCR